MKTRLFKNVLTYKQCTFLETNKVKEKIRNTESLKENNTASIHRNICQKNSFLIAIRKMSKFTCSHLSAIVENELQSVNVCNIALGTYFSGGIKSTTSRKQKSIPLLTAKINIRIKLNSLPSRFLITIVKRSIIFICPKCPKQR